MNSAHEDQSWKESFSGRRHSMRLGEEEGQEKGGASRLGVRKESKVTVYVGS